MTVMNLKTKAYNERRSEKDTGQSTSNSMHRIFCGRGVYYEVVVVVAVGVVVVVVEVAPAIFKLPSLRHH